MSRNVVAFETPTMTNPYGKELGFGKERAKWIVVIRITS